MHYLIVHTGLLILFPAFISAKVDGRVGFSWGAVFSPIFIVDGFILLGILLSPSISSPDPSDPDAVVNQTMGRVGKFLLFCYFASFTLFHIFLALQLDGTIAWNFGIVFSPLIIFEAVNLMTCIRTFAHTFAQGVYEGQPAGTEDVAREARKFTRSETIALLYDIFWFWILRVSLIVLLIVKLNGNDIPWALVFLPAWIWGLGKIVSLLVSYREYRKATSANPNSPEVKALFYSQVVGFIISAILFYILVGLLVSRLNVGSPSAGVILIPVFLILGLLFCCTCCCMPCLLCCVQVGIDEELGRGEGQELDSIAILSRKRIMSAGSSATVVVTQA